jgi:uncharacterized membrane protein
MYGYFSLILACVVFVGSHFLMSHPLRTTLVKIFGNGGFLGVYSLVSLAAIIWMVMAFRAAPMGAPLWDAGDRLWIVSSIITLIAAVLYAGSMANNPALPRPDADKLAVKEPTGVFHVTRHPMMWSFALWGVAHILIAPRPDVLIFVGSIIFLALFGAKAQEMKKQNTMGVDWDGWMRRTHYWPQLRGFLKIGAGTWLIGIILWLLATWAHNFFGAYAAGIFRWL